MKEFLITKENYGQRVDKYVKKVLKDAPASYIYKLFRKKDVKINSKWVKPEYILEENDVLRIYIKDEVYEDFSKPISIENIKFDIEIIYEDKNILVLNKPKGLLVHGDINEKKITLQNKVLSYLYKKGEYPNDENFIPSPVHRLDRNTSGIVIFAKNYLFSKKLMDLFKTKEFIEKEYLALVCGVIEKNGKIVAPIKKDAESGKVTISSIKDGGKFAETRYELLDNNSKYSLAKINLITGRTHQIRIHFSYINHPVVGDSKYGDFIINKEFKEKYHYENQFLHAYKFKFKELTDELSYLSNLEFKAKLFDKEKGILKILNFKNF